MLEELHVRVFGDAKQPTLIYLPGLHGDWTLITSFRVALGNRAHFVDVTYPRRLDWSMEHYTSAITRALQERGIAEGWLLAESWGSQLAWGLIERMIKDQDRTKKPREGFNAKGLVLAGGFVKHPWKWGPGALKWIGEHTPPNWYQMELKVFGCYASFRHRRAPETLESVQEFMHRRTEFDRRCMRQRLDLLDGYDPQETARRTQIPVHYLAGLVDPLVPWPLVRRWLRRNCPGYRGGKTFWLSDHNVLATAPTRAADLVLGWMQGGN